MHQLRADPAGAAQHPMPVTLHGTVHLYETPKVSGDPVYSKVAKVERPPAATMPPFNSRRAHRLAKGAKIKRPHFLDLPQGDHRCSTVLCELTVDGGANDEAYS